MKGTSKMAASANANANESNNDGVIVKFMTATVTETEPELDHTNSFTSGAIDMRTSKMSLKKRRGSTSMLTVRIKTRISDE